MVHESMTVIEIFIDLEAAIREIRMEDGLYGLTEEHIYNEERIKFQMSQTNKIKANNNIPSCKRNFAYNIGYG